MGRELGRGSMCLCVSRVGLLFLPEPDGLKRMEPHTVRNCQPAAMVPHAHAHTQAAIAILLLLWGGGPTLTVRIKKNKEYVNPSPVTAY
jgi:hypothetical protein